MAENAPFCTEHFTNFLRPAARTTSAAGLLFLYAPLFRRKLRHWLQCHPEVALVQDELDTAADTVALESPDAHCT